MKTIYLLRHAQATNPTFGSDDKQRPLTDVGITQVHQTAKFFQQKHIKLQKIIHSTAVRTTMTAETFATDLGLTALLTPSDELYNASIDRWLNVIRHLDNKDSHILCVGHNLGISRFADYLTDEDLPDMQTASLYAIKLATDDWQSVTSGIGSILWMFNP
jgi:phosphohistidine phosphatase